MIQDKILDLDGNVLAVGDNETGPDPREIIRKKVWVHLSTVSKRPTFRRADLRGFDFERRDIRAAGDGISPLRSCFVGASFAGSKMKGATLAGLDLRGADFTDCDMRGVRILACDLTGALFDNVDMSSDRDHPQGEMRTWIRNCVFDNVRATGSRFPRAEALHSKSSEGSVFRNCTFTQATFYGDWDGAIFDNCDMEWAVVGRPKVRAWPDTDRFGILTVDCNVDHLSLYRSLTHPKTLPPDFVLPSATDLDRDWLDALPHDDYFGALGLIIAAIPPNDPEGKRKAGARYESERLRSIPTWKIRPMIQSVPMSENASVEPVKPVKPPKPVASTPPGNGSLLSAVGVKWTHSGNSLDPDRQFIPSARVNIWVRPNRTGLLRVMSKKNLAGKEVDLGLGENFSLKMRRKRLYVASLSVSQVSVLSVLD